MVLGHNKELTGRDTGTKQSGHFTGIHSQGGAGQGQGREGLNFLGGGLGGVPLCQAPAGGTSLIDSSSHTPSPAPTMHTEKPMGWGVGGGRIGISFSKIMKTGGLGGSEICSMVPAL